MESGHVLALNFPVGLNPGLARILGVMLKLDFQRAILQRIPQITAQPKRTWCDLLFVCDDTTRLRSRRWPRGRFACGRDVSAGARWTADADGPEVYVSVLAGDLVGIGTLTCDLANECCAAPWRRPPNILISGGTGTGKTTLLNAVAETIPAGDGPCS